MIYFPFNWAKFCHGYIKVIYILKMKEDNIIPDPHASLELCALEN